MESNAYINELMYHAIMQRRASNLVNQALLNRSDPTAETLAETLGIKEGPNNHGDIPQEERKALFLNTVKLMNMRYFSQKTYSIFCNFAAKYLPDLIDKFLDIAVPNNHPEDVRVMLLFDNAYTAVLLELLTTRYLYTYMRSQKAQERHAKLLPTKLAEGIIAMAPHRDHLLGPSRQDRSATDFQEKLEKTLLLLSSILLVNTEDGEPDKLLPSEVRNGLKPWVRKWGPLTRLTTGFTSFQMAAMLLSLVLFGFEYGDSETMREAMKATQENLANSTKCAMHDCEKREGLKACTRSVFRLIRPLVLFKMLYGLLLLGRPSDRTLGLSKPIRPDAART